MEPGSASPSPNSFWFTQKYHFLFQFGYSVSQMKSPNSGVLTHEGHRKDNALFGSKKKVILKQSPSYI